MARSNQWIEFVRMYAKHFGLSYMCAISNEDIKQDYKDWKAGKVEFGSTKWRNGKELKPKEEPEYEYIIPAPKKKKVKKSKPKVELIEEEDEEEEIIPVPKKQKSNKVPEPEAKQIVSSSIEEEEIEPSSSQTFKIKDLLVFTETRKATGLAKKIESSQKTLDDYNRSIEFYNKMLNNPKYNQDTVNKQLQIINNGLDTYKLKSSLIKKSYSPETRKRFLELPNIIRHAINTFLQFELRSNIRKETGSRKQFIDVSKYFEPIDVSFYEDRYTDVAKLLGKKKNIIKEIFGDEEDEEDIPTSNKTKVNLVEEEEQSTEFKTPELYKKLTSKERKEQERLEKYNKQESERQLKYEKEKQSDAQKVFDLWKDEIFYIPYNELIKSSDLNIVFDDKDLLKYAPTNLSSEKLKNLNDIFSMSSRAENGVSEPKLKAFKALPIEDRQKLYTEWFSKIIIPKYLTKDRPNAYKDVGRLITYGHAADLDMITSELTRFIQKPIQDFSSEMEKQLKKVGVSVA